MVTIGPFGHENQSKNSSSDKVVKKSYGREYHVLDNSQKKVITIAVVAVAVAVLFYLLQGGNSQEE